MPKTIYIDMDGVLVDLESYIEDTYTPDHIKEFGIGGIVDRDLNIFYDAKPILGAVNVFKDLVSNPDLEVYILSTAPWANPEAWKAKRVWVEQNLGEVAAKRLILSHRKDLLIGDYLIDDRDNNGAAQFKGEHIKFGTKPYTSWKEVMKYLEKNLHPNSITLEK